jgi:uncharacterized damage-inducible protein DinB
MNSIDLLVAQIDQAYDRRSWHGTNLRGSIRGVSARQAVWRPHPDRHNIEEIVIHAAYWKYAVQRRLTGEKRGLFGFRGSNWFPREDCDPQQWQADVRQLHDAHRRLRKTVASMAHLDLRRRLSTSWTVADLVSGIIAHDLYHAGQIQLLKRLGANLEPSEFVGGGRRGQLRGAQQGRQPARR